MTRSGGFSVLDIGELNGSSPARRLHAHVRRRRLCLHGGRHQGDDARRHGAGGRRPRRRAASRSRSSAAASRATFSASRCPSSRGAPRSCALSTITITQISQGGRRSACSSTSSRASRTVGLSTGLTAELADPAIYVMAVDDLHGSRWYSDSRRGRGRDIPFAALLAARGKADRWLSGSGATRPSS